MLVVVCTYIYITIHRHMNNNTDMVMIYPLANCTYSAVDRSVVGRRGAASQLRSSTMCD